MSVDRKRNYAKFKRIVVADLKRHGLPAAAANHVAHEMWKEVNHHSSQVYGGGIDRKQMDDEYVQARNSNERIKKYISYAQLIQNGYNVIKIAKMLADAYRK